MTKNTPYPRNSFSSHFRSAIVIVLLLAPLPLLHGQVQRMIMPPYLQAVTDSGIIVMVECATDDPISAEFGTKKSYGRNARTIAARNTSTGTFVHRIPLENLEADTRYHYRVVAGEDHSDDASFVTAPRAGGNIRFAWMADCRTGTKIHDAIAARILSAEPRFSLYGGDLCLNPEYTSYKTEFFRPNQLRLAARVPFFNAAGNHEDWEVNTKAFTQAPGAVEDKPLPYYSFDYGPVHVLVLNTEVKYTVDSKQYAFAKADLSATAKPWKIVIAHKPAYCAGGHNEDARMKLMTSEIFEPAGVQIVLAGHSHFYQHNLVNGIRHLVIGSAGAPLYAPGTAPYTVMAKKSHCYAIMDADAHRFQLVVFNERGKELDRIDLKRPRSKGAFREDAPLRPSTAGSMPERRMRETRDGTDRVPSAAAELNRP